ncbi:MAG: excisionase family DNA-binding protein [Lentisphaeria bacterium]
MSSSKRIPAPVVLAIHGLASPYIPELDPQETLRRLSAAPAILAPAVAPTSPAPSEALTIREAAARLHIGRSKLFQLLTIGRLPRVMLGKRTLRIPSAAVEALARGEGV